MAWLPSSFSPTVSTMVNDPRIQPVELRAPHGARILEIRWADGTVSRIDHEILRGYCPCATCQGHANDVTYHAGGDLELVDLARVGNYALGLTWGDSHSGGIYAFEYLRLLGDELAARGKSGLVERGILPRR